MNKKIIIFISIVLTLLVVFGIIFAIVINVNETNEKSTIKNNNITYVSEKVTDDCIEDIETETTNSSDETVSPNSLLVLKKYYKECGHTINEYVELPQEIVNMTEAEVQEKYEQWELIGFSSSEIILYKEFEGQCGEHYILKNEDGKIVIYKLDENGEEVMYEKTDISTEFLTQTDLIKIENGFEVYGKEELNKVIEDFE